MQADRTTTTVMPVVALEPKVLGITKLPHLLLCRPRCSTTGGVCGMFPQAEARRDEKLQPRVAVWLSRIFESPCTTYQPNKPTNKHERARADERTYARTNRRRAASRTETHSDTQRHTGKHRETQRHTETYTHTQRHTQTQTHSHTNTDTDTDPDPDPDPDTDTDTDPDPDPDTDTDTDTQTHTQPSQTHSDSLRLTQTHSDSLSHSLHHSHTLSLFPSLVVARCAKMCSGR